MEYLSTPLDAKTPSPSELNGRKFGSMLPNVSNFSTQHSDRLVERHTAQLQHDAKGRSMCVSCLLAALSDTGTTLKINLMLVLFQIEKDRSYAITTESGQNISHNRIDLKKTNVQYTQQHNVSSANSMHANLSINPNTAKTNFKSSSKAELPGKEINVRNVKNDVYVTRSGCMSKLTARLIASMLIQIQSKF